MANFCRLIDHNLCPNIPNINGCANSSSVIIQRCCTCFDLLVQSSVGRATSLQKVC